MVQRCSVKSTEKRLYQSLSFNKFAGLRHLWWLLLTNLRHWPLFGLYSITTQISLILETMIKGHFFQWLLFFVCKENRCYRYCLESLIRCNSSPWLELFSHLNLCKLLKLSLNQIFSEAITRTSLCSLNRIFLSKLFPIVLPQIWASRKHFENRGKGEWIQVSTKYFKTTIFLTLSQIHCWCNSYYIVFSNLASPPVF